MFEKRTYKTAMFHVGKFDFCPTENTHSHSVTITVTAKNGLKDFELDAIIPCETDTLLTFVEQFKLECKNASVEILILEIYFNDIDMSFIHFYENN